MLAELELRVREKTDELIQVNFSVLTALARAVEKKDLGTYGHSMRVSALCGPDRGALRHASPRAGGPEDRRPAARYRQDRDQRFDPGKTGAAHAV